MRAITVRVSKLLAFVLRHQPDHAGLVLEDGGWARVDLLIAGLAARGEAVTREEIEVAVRTNDKKRFELSEDGAKIRASQGHSTPVELHLEEREPPAILYHGTFSGALDAIREGGLKKMERHHVHLSADLATAKKVGGRRGKPHVLEIAAAEMRKAGFTFYISANGVWLTDHVPPEFIRLWALRG